jgi:tripartite-type tricarboxylate transporter receptor subunit TctC
MAINFASSGNGTGTHLSMEMLMRATGMQLTHVPFKGATPSFTALASGTVQVGFTTPALAKQFINEGRLNALAVGGSKRLTSFPNVPSLADLGLLKFDVEVWFGLLAPKGTPQPVVDLLAKEIKRVLAEPGMFEKFDVLGFTIVGSTPAEFAELIKRETVRWPKVIKELGITAG